MQLRTAQRMIDMRRKNPAQPAPSWLFSLDHAFVYEMQTKGGLDLLDLGALNKPVLDSEGKPEMVPVLDDEGLPTFTEDGEPIQQERTKLDMSLVYQILYHLTATWRKRNGLKMTLEEFLDELPEEFGMPMETISHLFGEAFGGATLADNVKPAQKALVTGLPGNETPQEDAP